MHTFKKHVGNCQGVVIMNLEAEGQRGKLDCQDQAFPEKESKGGKTECRASGGEVKFTPRNFLVLVSWCLVSVSL